MQTLRNGWYHKHGMDMFHCCTLPSASQAAMLKKTKAKVELITPTNGGMELMKNQHKHSRRAQLHIPTLRKSQLEAIASDARGAVPE